MITVPRTSLGQPLRAMPFELPGERNAPRDYDEITAFLERAMKR